MSKPLTKRQQALADNLADPAIPTTTEAARRAGYTASYARAGARQTSDKLARQGHVSTSKLARLDKAKGLRALGERLLLQGAKETEALDPQAKLTVGAGLVKLALEMNHKYGLELEPDQGEALDAFLGWLWTLQVNAARYGLTPQGQAWARRLASRLGQGDQGQEQGEPDALDAELVTD